MQVVPAVAQRLTWAIEQASTKDSVFAEKLDTERIIAAGNSCGGVTALEMAAAQPEVAGVFVLSGSSALGSTNTDVMSKIEVPVGYIVGAKGEDVAEGAATADYEALNEGVPAMIIRRYAGDHFLVSTDPEVMELEARMSTNWVDFMLYGTQQAYDELMTDSVCTECKSGDWSLESKNLESLL